MPSLVRLGLWLLAAKLGNAFEMLQTSDPTATAAPNLEERDVDSMVGIFVTNNEYQTMYCNPGRTPVDVSGHVLCSSPGFDPVNATTAVTACSNSYALFGTTSVACVSPTTCGSMLLLLSPRATSTETWIACGSGLPPTIYRNPPSIIAASTDSGRMTTSTSTSSSSSTTQASSSTSSAAPASTSAPSQAWIAGPVIGGVVAIALIGFLVWWIMRRKRRNQAQQQPVAAGAQTTEYPKAGSPPVMSQWSSPASTYATPYNQFQSPTSPPGTVPPYQSQFPSPAPISPSPNSQYPQGPSPVQGYAVPPGQFPPQQAQWQAPAPIHEMPAQNYDGPAELSGNVDSHEAAPNK